MDLSRCLPALLLSLSLAAPAAALTCEEGIATGSAPLLTPVITATLNGDYRSLTEAIDPIAAMGQPARQQLIAELEALSPLGYEDCAVLVARPLGPEFETYLLMFASSGQRLYAFLGAARINGAWTVIHHRFSPDFAQAYDLLR
ncbi:MAG: hypothetical protein RIT14_924 [Pseudomonadota bacterium]